ncbi:hypothetical protein MASR1M60_16140 [Rhodocyclaceae bacterium]
MVVTAEEGGEVGVDSLFFPFQINAFFQHGTQFFDRRRLFGVEAGGVGGFDGVVEGGLFVGQARRLEFFQGLAQGGHQVLVEKAGDLVALGIHDAIDAKVQIGLVHLEQLFELVDELLALCVGVVHHGLSGVYA